MQTTITAFDHAFNALCRSLLHYKAEPLGPQTPFYIWRTRGDGRVRASHAENDGRLFDRNNPPATGNPGEDYGCRCWAEPEYGNVYVEQTLISSINDVIPAWTDRGFFTHFLGSGTPVTLQETGYLSKIIDFFAFHALASDGLAGVYRSVNQQIMQAAKKVGNGAVPYSFNNTYNFYDVLYTFRNSTVKGEFAGDVRRDGDYLVINGIMTYSFFDEFADPISLVEVQVRAFGIDRTQAQRNVNELANFFGRIYPITDVWKTKFNATILEKI
jgi:hypothetical protein